MNFASIIEDAWSYNSKDEVDKFSWRKIMILAKFINVELKMKVFEQVHTSWKLVSSNLEPLKS